MRKTLLGIFVCTLVILSTVVPSCALSPIDPERESSLVLQYKYGENCFGGLEIKTYRVAEVFEDGTYALTGEFADYPVNIYGITTGEEWDAVASTLGGYAAADGIEADHMSVTDETGTVRFSEILPGMYLTLSVKSEKDAEVFRFETFLTVIPQPKDDGDHEYDVTAYPKCESYTTTPDMIEYKIVKQWKDSGYAEKRPEYIEVDILKDGVLESTKKLTAENNWAYSWTAPNDGAQWQAVERNVPKDYTVTVSQNGKTIVLTNVHNYPGMNAPQTGDTFVFWHYALIMCLAGGIIMIVAVWRKRTEG